MRLIDTRTSELRWFNDNDIPKYAILSHTWGSDEVTYQELVWINRAKALSGSSMDQPSSSAASFTSEDDQATIMLAAIEMMIRGNSGTSLGSITEQDLMKRAGYSKLKHAAEQARSQGYNYIWVDTCCIDKSSSAELQEAINSMFRWYRDAEVCASYTLRMLRNLVGAPTQPLLRWQEQPVRLADGPRGGGKKVHVRTGLGRYTDFVSN
ncbi:HET-domain-containing protein [Cucurbitaria berberidis CBS 394.84]|uniref:HET-domain-containing protein n=1 Tax=Cucurbitaria berberidis CBS 394.84 TaxID=1168544 RepID=A0A9P4LC85_9PLEO|nr:HET-domain-containing protein [Cucurbitaria berberidis CBS 394.84]KAF1849443.1 HET-domain-containing protein [Cucurbitaria berberidis CBS 394.84]